MECTAAIDAVDKKLGCHYLRWSIDDEIDHIISDEDRTRAARSMDWREPFSIDHVRTKTGCVHIVRANFTFSLLSNQLA